MRRTFLLAASLLATVAWAQQHNEMTYVASTAQAQIDAIGKKGIVTVEVSNPNDQAMKDAPVCIKLPDLKKYKSVTVRAEGIEIPSQLDDLNGDGTYDELSLVVDLDAKATKTLELTFGKKPLPADRYESRVFTDMRLRVVKKGRTIDLRKENYQIDTISEVEDIHYSDVYPHGLCFENELMGYRVYFNSGHGTDLYGKRVPQLELDRSMWYTPEIRDSAALYNYGEDYIIVGQTASLGTLRGWDDSKDDPNYCKTPSGAKIADPCMVKIEPFDWRQAHIVAKGPVRTVVDMNVEGWQYKGQKLNLKARYILYAGNREHQVVNQLCRVTDQGETCEGLDKLEFVTGVMKVGSLNHDSVDVAIQKYICDGKGFAASYGKDWPDGNHKLFPYMSKAALAISVPQTNVTRTIDRREQILYGVKPNADGSIVYRVVCAAPDLETFAPFEDGRWNWERWFEWCQQWKEGKAAVVKVVKGE